MIRLSKSCITNAEKNAVQGVLDREFLGMGNEVQQFEEALGNFFGRPVACVANGTAALQLALQGCGIKAGDEVLVPSLTYVASFQAISATGATPVPCDINPNTCILDWRDAVQRLTDKTKAIMPVHYSGGVDGLNEIYQFANCHDLRVVEDAAHAFGTSHDNSIVGGFGDVACFSFDGIKNITSGEGGCVVTDDLQVLRFVQDARLLGVVKDTEMRYSAQRSWEFNVSSQGWRYHMSNIMAAIGLEQLKKFPELSKRRQHRACYYDKLFADNERIMPLIHDYSKVVPHIYVVRIRNFKNRNKIREKLLREKIQTGIHYQPNHWLDFYRTKNGCPLPETEKLYAELLTLPLHPDLTEKKLDYVCEKLLSCIEL